MKRRGFLKALAGMVGVAVAPVVLAEQKPAFRPVQTSACYQEGPWLWNAKLDRNTCYWLVNGLHRTSFVVWTMLVPERHLKKRGVSIDAYLAERPSVHRAYVDLLVS